MTEPIPEEELNLPPIDVPGRRAVGKTPKPYNVETQRLSGYAGANPLPKGVKRGAYEKICVMTEMHYRTNRGNIPTLEELIKLTGLSERSIARTISSREFVKRMGRHGIRWEQNRKYPVLNPEQVLLIKYISDPTVKLDLREKLKKAGIPYSVYRTWLTQPAFREALFSFAEDTLDAHTPDFNTKLVEKGLTGDLNAIRFIYELTGRHDPTKQQTIDFQRMVMLLVEIVTRNVRDPETLRRINSEMDNVIKGDIVNVKRIEHKAIPDNYRGPLAPDVTRENAEAVIGDLRKFLEE